MHTSQPKDLGRKLAGLVYQMTTLDAVVFQVYLRRAFSSDMREYKTRQQEKLRAEENNQSPGRKVYGP